MYTFGGNPADVLVDQAGNAVSDWPVNVRVAGTGELVSALFEEDGTTPVGQLRSNASATSAPGAIRTFKISDIREIQYEYLDGASNPVRWYEAARELAPDAADASAAAVTTANSAAATADAAQATAQQALQIAELAGADLSRVGWHTVAAYGAVGNGVVDDTAAIQAALDAAYAASGGVVVFSGGAIYNVSTFLVVRDNTVLWAYGATIRSVSTNMGLLRNFYSTDTFAGYAGHSHIAVLGGTWDGNASDGVNGTVTAETDVMNFVHCADITVRDATILNTSSAHALEFNSCDGGRAVNCRFLGFRDNSGDGSRATSEAVQIDLAKSGSSSIGNFDGTTAKDIRIEGCYFGASDRLGAFGRAVGSHASLDGSYFDNIQIADNRIDGTSTAEGIHGYCWRRAIVANNVITGTALSGVKVTVPDPSSAGYSITPDSLVISGNTISLAGGDSAIRVIGYATAEFSSVSISDNVIRNVTVNGIQAERCIGPSIAGNDVDTTTSTGILAQYSNSASVVGNTVRNVGSNGINAAGSVGVHVGNNLVDITFSNHGVYVGPGADGTNGTDTAIVGNTVVAAASAGIRLSTNAARCTVTGNRIRKGSGTTANGITLAAGATGCLIAGNNLSGNGWNGTPTTAISVSTAAPKTNMAGTITTVPGDNAIFD